MSQRHLHGFRSPFLQAMEQQFNRRAKPLRNRGSLSIDGEQRDDGESWLEVVLVTTSRFSVCIVLKEQNRANLFIRSARAANRGRVLLRVEDLRVSSNGAAIVAAFEETVALAHDLDSAPDAAARIEALWNSMHFRIS